MLSVFANVINHFINHQIIGKKSLLLHTTKSNVYVIMKKLLLLAIASVVMLVAGCSNSSAKETEEEVVLTTTADSVTYHLGRIIGAQLNLELKSNKHNVDKAEVIASIRKALGYSDNEFMQYGDSLGRLLQAGPGADSIKVYSQYNGALIALNVRQAASHAGGKAEAKAFFKGFNATIEAKDTVNTSADETALNAIFMRLNAAAAASTNAAAEKNKTDGAAYIDKMMKEDKGYKKTASGLVYKIVKKGSGANITADQTACVRYEGRHIDGTVFDNGQGQVQEFPVSAVVPGFSEGLMLMNKGTKITLIIPGDLGYGERGAGGSIRPNETLVFDVELVDIK